MFALAQRHLKSVLPANLRPRLRAQIEGLKIRSLRAALAEQGLASLLARLEAIVPDIRQQYTTYELDTEYLRVNVRAVHTFQIHMVEQAITRLQLDPTHRLTIVDIGDSAGTHIQYLNGLHPDWSLRCLGLNLDQQAVDKIKAKGLEAVCARAEELPALGIDADIFLSFETLEHLLSPIQFLKDLADTSACRAFVITVPYVAQSRVGLRHIRLGQRRPATPEDTHIFELSPRDWGFLAQQAGWAVAYEQTYLQYPRFGLWRVLKDYWKLMDFEGFWGAVLVRDSTWKDLYTGW